MITDVAYRVSQMGGDPALFDDIGKEVTDMTTRDPFLVKNVYLGAMQNYVGFILHVFLSFFSFPSLKLSCPCLTFKPYSTSL